MSKFVSVWEFDLLWEKCRFYYQKALSETRESPMFPFWCALGLEFLARATLAKVHPVLLADPREGDNILYVFGFSKAEAPPKSIVAKTVFARCSKVVPDFTKKEEEACLRLIEKRNEELHSGSAAFVEFSTKLWLADHYKACKILLASIGFSLRDLIGAEENAAEEMIKEVDKTVQKDVNSRIAKAKEEFEKLVKEEREARIKHGSEKAIENFHGRGGKLDVCISCGSKAFITGKTAVVSEDKLEDGEIIYERVILPTSFTCFSCGLNFFNHQEMAIAGYGGQFTERVTWDPAEYHGIDHRDIYPDLYDYGND